MPDYVVYNVAKAGLRGLTHALARDLAPNSLKRGGAGPDRLADDGQIAAAERERILSQVPLKEKAALRRLPKAVKYPHMRR